MSKICVAIAVMVVVTASSITCAGVTPVEQCPGLIIDNLQEKIQVIPCGKTRCKLQKGTNVTVVFKFKPKTEIKSLTNRVHGEIGGLPIPFIGVDGTTACEHVTFAEDNKPASCPLAADQEYVYTNVFPIQSLYPQVQLRVHWGIHDGKQDIICFEVPAVITK